ncbi:hypothetical protein NIES2111_20950 [Nostoc sp. NIES-2111]|nr:hypothetical protein NIES2111_20950 [Nostoc sp. NIES-2111]
MNNIFFILLLFSSLLGRVNFPVININIHYLLIPIFSLVIIISSQNFNWQIIKKHKTFLLSLTIVYLWMWLCSIISPFSNLAIVYTIKYSPYFLIFLAFLFLTYRKNKILYLSFYYRCILYLIQIIAFLGFVEYLFPELWLFKLLKYPSFHPQIGSIMQNPNQFGVTIAIGLCMSLILEQQRIISKFELFLSEFLFLISLALSASRNAWLIFMLGLFLLLIYKIISFRKAILLVILWFFLVIFLPISTYRIGLGNVPIFPLINLFLDNSAEVKVKILDPVGTALSRFSLWQAAIIETIQRPISGIGVGIFAEHIGFKTFGGLKGYHAHNIFLNVLAEQGIAGLVIFANFLIQLTSKVKHGNPVIVIPIILFLVCQLPDFFIEDYAFTTIELYFIAVAINSQKYFEIQEKKSIANTTEMEFI